MKRSRSGEVIHRDDCQRAGSAVHWAWADGMSEREMILRSLAYPHLRLGRCCFIGTKEKLAAGIAREAAAARRRLEVAAAEYGSAS